MGTLEPELGEEVKCGAHLSGQLHPGLPCQLLSACLCMPVVPLQTHTACAFFSHSSGIKRVIEDAGKKHQGLDLSHSGARAGVLSPKQPQGQPQG